MADETKDKAGSDKPYDPFWGRILEKMIGALVILALVYGAGIFMYFFSGFYSIFPPKDQSSLLWHLILWPPVLLIAYAVLQGISEMILGKTVLSEKISRKISKKEFSVLRILYVLLTFLILIGLCAFILYLFGVNPLDYN